MLFKPPRPGAMRRCCLRLPALLATLVLLLSLSGIAHALTRYASDSFTAPDNTLLSAYTGTSGQSYVNVADNALSPPVIKGNALAPAGALPALMVANSLSLTSADYEVKVTLTAPSTATPVYAGVIARANSSGSCYVLWYDQQNNLLEIFYFANGHIGGSALITRGASVSTSGTVVGLRCQGSTLSITQDGVVLGSVVDTNLSAAGRAGVSIGQQGTGGDPSVNGWRITNWRVASSRPPPSNGIVYVSPSQGDDDLGEVYTSSTNNPAKFATINAAMRALLPGTSTSRNTVQLYAERYAPVRDGVYYPAAGYTDSVCYPYTTWKGAGMPSVSANGRTLVTGSGTIFQGRFFSDADGVEVYDLGIDRGLDVVAALGLSQDDTFSPSWQHNQNNPTEIPRRVGIVVKNVVALSVPGVTVHAFLIEHTSGAYVQNVVVVFGFAGFVSKNVNLVVRQVTALGQYTGHPIDSGFYVKSNGYDDNTGERGYDIFVGPYNGTGTGAVSAAAATVRFLNEGGTLDNNVIDGFSLVGVGITMDGTNNAATNIVSSDGTVYNSTGNGNTLSSAAATVSSLTLTLSPGKTLASTIVLPVNAPQYIRYSISGQGARIDSYTGVIDLSAVPNGTQVTITALSYFGANATPVTTSKTFTKGANVFRRANNPERRGVRAVQ